MKMMKRLMGLICAVMMVGSLAACGNSSTDAASGSVPSSESTSSAASETSERTTFTLGFDAEYPPYGYKDDNGEYVGYDLSLAAEVCNRMGWKLVLQPIEWDSKDLELDCGNIDVIWNGMTMTGRESDYTWVGPYVDNSIVFVVLSDSGITAKEDLSGKAVITQSGSSALTALTDDPGDGSNDENLALAASFSVLDQTPDYNSAFLNLESGVDEAIAVDIGVANYQLAARGDGFMMLDEPLSTEQYGIAFKKGNTELANQVTAVLDKMKEDGTFAEISETWGLSDMVCYGN